jgi:protein-S-isoprenylcysteine O-methyltransferase Ste14
MFSQRNRKFFTEGYSNQTIIYEGYESREKLLMKRTLILIYGLLCYLLGAAVYFGGLGGFLANLLGRYSIDRGMTAEVFPALPINLGLILLFGLPHSLMARPRFKQWWARLIPAAAERSTYMLQASLMVLLLIWQWRAVPDVVWSLEQPWLKVFTWGLYLSGWLIAFLATLAIDHFELTGLKQVYAYFRRQPPRQTPFQTPFLYRIVRHPMQLGLLIAFWATPHMTVGRLIFALGMMAYICIGLTFEERDLVRRFGDLYLAYREQTPSLLPLRLPRGKPARTLRFPITKTPEESARNEMLSKPIKGAQHANRLDCQPRTRDESYGAGRRTPAATRHTR